jgi:serine/threonine protein kinase/Tfp pilus assembly protein PilF
MLKTGQKIGRFELVQKLGAGGFGEVYAARDPDRTDPVAVKILHSTLYSDPDIRTRFLSEARALERLSHPNIVHFVEAGEDAAGLYIVTEYIEGESLRERLSSGGIVWQDALNIVIQVANALSDAHSRNVLHRDLKPGNIILHPDRGAVLLDFGLVRFTDEKTVTKPGQLMGTWKYMSPEQLRGEKVDRRSDIFSLGIVLYELLTGLRPFTGEYDAAIVYSIMHDEPAPLPWNRTDIPGIVNHVIDRSLRKEPEGRYEQMADLAEDLKLILEGKRPIQRWIEETSTAPPRIITLAVLCLHNQGPAENEFIAYGITEELISELSREQRLRVSPVKSVRPFSQWSKEPSAVAQRLGVRYLVRGSLASFEEPFVAEVELIDTSTANILWSTKWSGEQASLTELKELLACGILEALGIAAKPMDSQATASVSGMPDPVAYEYYLRGKYLFEHKKSGADVEVAAQLYRQAIQKEPRLTTAALGLARIHIHEGDYQGAISELETALQRSRSESQEEVEIESHLSLADAYYRLADWDKSAMHARKARELSRRNGNLSLEARALAILIDILEPQARYDDAMAYYRRVIKINQQLQRKDKLAAAVKSIAVIHHRRGKLDLALHHYNEALELCRWQGQVGIEAKLMNNIGLVQHQLGKEKDAQESFEKALELHRQLGEYGSIAVNLNNLGVLRFTSGDYAGAMDRFVEAAEAAVDVKDRKNQALALENQGKTQVMLGNYSRATILNREARELASSLKFQLVLTMAERNLGDIALYENRVQDAEDHYRRAMAIADKADLKNEECIVILSRMKLTERTGQFVECVQLAETALKLVRELHTRKLAQIISAYRAFGRYMTSHRSSDLTRLKFLRKNLNDRCEPPSQIAVRRLLATAVLKGDSVGNSVEMARAVLNEAIELSRRYKIKYEQEWVGALLDTIADS